MLEAQKERILKVLLETRNLDPDPEAKPVSPMMVGVREGEDRIILVWPGHDLDSKQEVYQAAGLMLALAGCDSAVFGADVWVAEMPKDTKIDDIEGPVRDMPGHKDALVITALTKDESDADIHMYEMAEGKVKVTKEVKTKKDGAPLEGWVTSLFQMMIQGVIPASDEELEIIVELAQGVGWQVEVRS